MSKWALHKLGDLVEILSGFAFDAARFGDTGEIPIARIRDVVRGRTKTFFVGEYDSKYLIKDQDILIGMDGEFNRARWSGGSALLNQRVCKIRSSHQNLDEGYLYRFLPAALKSIEDATPFVTVKHLSIKTIRDIQLPLPPLDEQKRIAAVLDKADALRRQRQESLQLTEKLLQAVFVDMFGDPADQRQSRLSDLLNKPLRNGLSPASGGQFSGTVFTLSAITRGFFNSSAQKEAVFAAPPKAAAYVDQADFLICRGNGNLNLCGQGQFPSHDAIGIIFPDTIIAASINLQKVSKAYFATLWNQPFVRQQIEAGARTAAGIFKVNQTTLENIQIPVPAFERQVAFGKIAETITYGRIDLGTSAQYAESLFSSLQQRAFRGELDLRRLVLDPSDDLPVSIAPAMPVTQPNKPEVTASFIQAPAALEPALKKLDRTLSEGDPIPWSADYFKYRILAAQPAPFSFANLMQSAETVFEQPLPSETYDKIRELIFDLLGQDGKPALLRQRFDQREVKEHNSEGKEITSFVGRKEIVFEPVP